MFQMEKTIFVRETDECFENDNSSFPFFEIKESLGFCNEHGCSLNKSIMFIDCIIKKQSII